MLFLWIPLILIGLSVIVLLVIALQKIPQLRALDVYTSPEVKARQLKNTLMANRLTRAGERYFGVMKRMAQPAAKAAGAGMKTAIGKLTKLEEHYQKMRKEAMGPHAMDGAAIKKIVEEAEELIEKERYGEAEKRLIEVLSHDPKNAKAYEVLGDLYVMMKNYDQAEETFRFILKLSPEDASVVTSLGEIEMQRENFEKAKEYFAKAIKLRPNNPKYLDFSIEACLQAGDAAGAKKGIEQLRKVNPQNQKLGELDERAAELSKRPTRQPQGKKIE